MLTRLFNVLPVFVARRRGDRRDRGSGKAVAERSDTRAEHVATGHMKIDGRCPPARKTAR